MDLHGGNIYKLERQGKKNILDYSSNINPLGLPKNFIEQVNENFDILTKYPDPDYIELKKKIADFNDLNSENILVGNGATEILFLYVRALKPKKVLVIAPCFAEYKRALDSVEVNVDFFELEEKNDFILDFQKLEEKLKEKYELLVLCNPNNPTGKFIDLDKIEKIVSLVKKKNMKLFVDEAFIEFTENWKNNTVVLFKSENVFVMRALTKFFAIPGLRLGYGIIFDKSLKNKMEIQKEPWSVNAFANLAGIKMLDEINYIEETEEWIKKEKIFMFEELDKISNLKAYKTDSNFILLRLEKIKSNILRDKMLEKNILIRDASNFKFLDDKFIRLAIRDRGNNLKVIESLKDILNKL